jgi:hypothetical protein
LASRYLPVVFQEIFFLEFFKNPHNFSSPRTSALATPLYGCDQRIGVKAQNFFVRRKNTMVSKSSVLVVPKPKIYGLSGGRIRTFYYFLGISESPESDVFTDIMYVKLLNQRGTQKTVFSEGYEPFRTSYRREAELCLKAMTIPVPRLKLVLAGWPNSTLTPRIGLDCKAACILDPSGCSKFCVLGDPAMEAFQLFHVLRVESEVFEIKHRIRVHAAKTYSNLSLVLQQLAYPGGVPLSSNPAEQLEKYLAIHSPDSLRGLLARLDMPDSSPAAS